MTTIDLKAFGIVITLGEHTASIASDLKEPGGLQTDHAYNCAMDGIESLILAHAKAGIDVAAPSYVEAVKTAVNGCANNL